MGEIQQRVSSELPTRDDVDYLFTVIEALANAVIVAAPQMGLNTPTIDQVIGVAEDIACEKLLAEN
jgi:hypothetical protein